MTIESAIALSIAIILLTLKPGPGVLAIISRSLGGGFPSGLAITLGISTIHMVFYGIVVMGLSLLEYQMEFITFLFILA
jgi:threonine/homoserine/homoserine lactone efflux protein